MKKDRITKLFIFFLMVVLASGLCIINGVAFRMEFFTKISTIVFSVSSFASIFTIVYAVYNEE